MEKNPASSQKFLYRLVYSTICYRENVNHGQTSISFKIVYVKIGLSIIRETVDSFIYDAGQHYWDFYRW